MIKLSKEKVDVQNRVTFSKFYIYIYQNVKYWPNKRREFKKMKINVAHKYPSNVYIRKHGVK